MFSLYGLMHTAVGCTGAYGVPGAPYYNAIGILCAAIWCLCMVLYY